MSEQTSITNVMRKAFTNPTPPHEDADMRQVNFNGFRVHGVLPIPLRHILTEIRRARRKAQKAQNRNDFASAKSREEFADYLEQVFKVMLAENFPRHFFDSSNQFELEVVSGWNVVTPLS